MLAEKLSVWTLLALFYFVAFGLIVVLGFATRSHAPRRRRGPRRQR